eukprot:15024772-Ditylum_brightwellii.AAC.1
MIIVSGAIGEVVSVGEGNHLIQTFDGQLNYKQLTWQRLRVKGDHLDRHPLLRLQQVIHEPSIEYLKDGTR